MNSKSINRSLFRFFLIGSILIGTLFSAVWFSSQATAVQAVSENQTISGLMADFGIQIGNTRDNPLETIQQQLAHADLYDYDANIQQNYIPRATTANIGKSNERVTSYISGKATGPQQAQLTLRMEGAGANVPAIQLEQDGTKMYLLENGERTLLKEPPQAVAGMQNPAAFFIAAENIQLAPHDQDSQTTIYTFDINGSRYAKVEVVRLDARFLELIEHITALQPNMIIIERNKAYSGLVLDLVNQGLPLLEVDASENMVTLLNGRRVPISETGDLVRLISENKHIIRGGVR